MQNLLIFKMHNNYRETATRDNIMTDHFLTLCLDASSLSRSQVHWGHTTHPHIQNTEDDGDGDNGNDDDDDDDNSDDVDYFRRINKFAKAQVFIDDGCNFKYVC